jgi:hypothetical protein
MTTREYATCGDSGERKSDHEFYLVSGRRAWTYCKVCTSKRTTASAKKRRARQKCGDYKERIYPPYSTRARAKFSMGFACSRCNSIKSDFFSEQEMRAIAERFIVPKVYSFRERTR